MGALRWEIAVPSGTYKIRVVVGDPSYTDVISKLTVERTLTIHCSTSSSARWLHGTATVSFFASAPITAAPVRGFTNGRSEFPTTPLPIAELTSGAGFPILFPNNRTGEGWDSEIQLVNPNSGDGIDPS
jgi:hypothetical protein